MKPEVKTQQDSQVAVGSCQVVHAPTRLTIGDFVHVVEFVDCVSLMGASGLMWGHLSTNLTKLEESGGAVITEGYRGDKPHTTVRLSDPGRAVSRRYKQSRRKVLNDLPD